MPEHWDVTNGCFEGAVKVCLDIDWLRLHIAARKRRNPATFFRQKFLLHTLQEVRRQVFIGIDHCLRYVEVRLLQVR